MNRFTQLKEAAPVFLVVLPLTCLCLGRSPNATGAIPEEIVNVIYSFAGDEDR
jgi:hypothetical protein